LDLVELNRAMDCVYRCNIYCRAPTVDPKNRYSTFGPQSKVRTIEKMQPKTKPEVYYQWVISFFENYRRQIFWAVLYTLVLFGVFIERAYCKSFRQNSLRNLWPDLWRIFGAT